MTKEKNFNQLSYQSHESHYSKYVRDGKVETKGKTWFDD